MLLAHYRNHIIVVLSDHLFSAEITEQKTAAPFPTKVSATRDEGLQVCLDRARALIDLYLEHHVNDDDPAPSVAIERQTAS